jgi:hypothetical protein
LIRLVFDVDGSKESNHAVLQTSAFVILLCAFSTVLLFVVNHMVVSFIKRNIARPWVARLVNVDKFKATHM